ncbi:hypothetical protein QYE76_068802 [Lolium multiflorum]|uniref:Transposase-associated domain-containing protein n=1 Tax=Lolium multiflorum TaxID=4521 RepID=A0AAD8SGZ6_LOLMU|nr:hypothetical protein QYE76_068802 [Lolium multiflorum]
MYGNRCAPAFRDGVNSFLLVAEANKSKQGFMCCPCLKCKNEKDYSCSRDIKSHLLRFEFMSSYNVWTKHGEEGVMMEDDDEEEDNDDQYRSMFSECDDTVMEDTEEEGGEEQAADDPVDDDLRCEDGQRKLGSILELLKWKAGRKLSEAHPSPSRPGWHACTKIGRACRIFAGRRSEGLGPAAVGSLPALCVARLLAGGFRPQHILARPVGQSATSTASPSTSEMADGTPVTYEDLTEELKKKYDEVKAILEADLIGSFTNPLTWHQVERVLT